MLGTGQNPEDRPYDNPFHIARTEEEALARRQLTGIYEQRANRMEPFSVGVPTMYGPTGMTQPQLLPESQATIDGQEQQQYWQQNRDWRQQQMQPDPLIQPALTGQQLTGTSFIGPQLPGTQLQLPSTQLLQPGTSPFASKVFIRSKKDESRTFDSSMINAIFSPLQPDRRRTFRKSSSKFSPVYFRWTFT